MHRAALLNYAILSLPTTGHATKREFCIAGQLASMLRGIVLAGKEKKYFRSCGTNEVMSHLYRVLTSCKNSCLYEHAIYQVALALRVVPVQKRGTDKGACDGCGL
jgi:hypothetical protein